MGRKVKKSHFFVIKVVNPKMLIKKNTNIWYDLILKIEIKRQ